MVFRSFDELIARQKAEPHAARMAVAAAGDEHTSEAVLHARQEGIVRPLLVGDKAAIDAALKTVPKDAALLEKRATIGSAFEAVTLDQNHDFTAGFIS